MIRLRRCLLVLLLAATACAPGGPEPIEIGAIYPTAGNQGVGGIDEWRGVQLAAERVNASGGVGGRPVELVLERTDSADAAPGAIESLVDDGSSIILGSYGSTISRPAANAAARLGALFWESGAVGLMDAAAAPGEHSFRFPPTGAVLGREAVRFVDTQIAPKVGGDPLRYAVVYVDDDYGRAVGQGAVDAVAELGRELVAHVPYELRTADFDAVVAEVADSGADVLFVSAYLEDGIEIRRAVLRRGLELDAMIGTSSSYCMHEFGEALGLDAVGVFASDKPDGDFVDPDALTGEAPELLSWASETFRERHGKHMSAAALSGFSAAWALFAHVMPSAEALTPKAVAEAARRVRIPAGGLPNGSGLEFAPPGHAQAGNNLRATSVIWEWVGDEERAIVWPPAFATHPIEVARA